MYIPTTEVKLDTMSNCGEPPTYFGISGPSLGKHSKKYRTIRVFLLVVCQTEGSGKRSKHVGGLPQVVHHCV